MQRICILHVLLWFPKQVTWSCYPAVWGFRHGDVSTRWWKERWIASTDFGLLEPDNLASSCAGFFTDDGIGLQNPCFTSSL